MAKATYIQREYRLFQIKNNAKKKINEIKADQYKEWKIMQ